MTQIDTLHIHNFKFFDEQKPIELKEKHLLLYGENGSGKSSIYWGLYTLFECSLKAEEEIKKYFKCPSPANPESLVNIYAINERSRSTKTKEHSNSFIRLKTNNKRNNIYKVSIFDQKISKNPIAQEILKASDFLSYKDLFKFQDFWNGQEINLNSIFISSILPYLQFESVTFNKIVYTSADEIFYLIQETEKNFQTSGIRKRPRINQIEIDELQNLINHFTSEMNKLIDFININSQKIILELGYNIAFHLKNTDLKQESESKYIFWNFDVKFHVSKYNGEDVNMHRPQSFLNEAKITAIALSIRLSILRKRINEQARNILKFIVFDDIMISLDMSNRDKLIDFILNPANKFTADYQLLFLTHDKNLFDFVANKIKQWDKIDNWVYKEMYAGKVEASKKEYPIIIDSDLEFIDKAQKYFDAKDYTACSIYIRKEVEKIVNQRLPPVLKEKVDGSFLSLQTLWGNMLKRYTDLGKPIAPDLIKIFDETKLMVLNPQAHFQDISLPIYKVELEKAFFLIKELKDKYPIPIYTIVLAKGMKLQFKHPTEDYTFDFELLSNFNLIGLDGTVSNDFPKCKITNWSYKGTDFFSPGLNKVVDGSKVQKRDDELDKLLDNLKKDIVLKITNDMFIGNTIIENCIWSFKEILDKAKIIL